MPNRMFPSPRAIAVEGHNCWTRAHADRLSFLVDGENYFAALKAALWEARHSIIILGWEFDSRTRLERSDGAGEPNTVGDLLRCLVRSRRSLEVHLLIWDPVLLYSFDREFLPVVKHHWLSHPRLNFRLDGSHPLGASHHQKVVVIDDQVAFLGGLDISSKRWDSPAHRPDDPRRSDPGFPHYPPFHDVQVAISGQAAAALGELARRRWRNASGRRIAPAPRSGHDAWPANLPPDLEDVTVALARTLPPWEGEAAIHEVEQLFVDMIAAAERTIYIENQYFASRAIARILARRLGEPECPEIAMVTSGFSAGFLERTTMGVSRARLQGRLQNQDRHGRLGLYAPIIEDTFLKVHAKVMVIDDRMLRVGSANLNNRSMGLDTECDLMLEATGRPAVAQAIAGFRDRLLAEHLGRQPAEVGTAIERDGVHSAILTLQTPRRRLEPLHPTPLSTEYLPEGELLDPEGPVETMLLAATPPSRGAIKKPLAGRFATGIGLLTALTLIATFWRWMPHSPWPAVDATLVQLGILRDHPLSPLLVGGGFLVLGLTGFPIFLLVMAVGSIYGAWPGGLYAFLGTLGSAAFSYSLGRALGRDVVRRLTGARATRVSRALVRHGIIAMAMLRIMPVASFTAVNLMAGASRLRHRDYFLGSFVGLTPMVIGFSIFGDRFAAVIEKPDAFNTGSLTILALLLALLGFAVFSRMSRAAASPGTDGRAALSRRPAGNAPVSPLTAEDGPARPRARTTAHTTTGGQR